MKNYITFIVAMVAVGFMAYMAGLAMRGQTVGDMSLPPLKMVKGQPEVPEHLLGTNGTELPDPIGAEDVSPETEAALNSVGLSATSIVKIAVVAQPLPPVVVKGQVNLNVGQ